MRLAETTCLYWFEYSLQWLYLSCQASPANSTLRPRSTLPSSRSQLPTYSSSASNSVVPGSRKSNFCTKLQLVDLAGSECVGELVILYACIIDYWIRKEIDQTCCFFFTGVSGVSGSALREAQYINKRYIGVHLLVKCTSV